MLGKLGTQSRTHHFFLTSLPLLFLDILDAFLDTLGRLSRLGLHDLLKRNLVGKLTSLLSDHVVLDRGILNAVNQGGSDLFIAEHTRIALGLIRRHEEHRRRTFGFRLGLELACGLLDDHRLFALHGFRRLLFLGRLDFFHHRNRDFLHGLRLATRTTEDEGTMQEAELLLFGTQTNLLLLVLELLEHLRTHKRESGFAQDFGDLVKRNQLLLRWNLEALEKNTNLHAEFILPIFAVAVLLGELTLDLTTRTKNLALLTQKHRVDCLTVQAGSKEDIPGDVLDEGTEGILRIAGLVNGELATDGILLLQPRELLELRRGTRLFAAEDLEVGMIVLRKVLRHVRRNEEHRGNLCALGTLLQHTSTRSLTRSIQVALGQIQTHDTRRLGMQPLLEIPRTTHREFQEGASRNHTLLVQTILDTIVKSLDILENAFARIQVVAVVDLILKGIIRRMTGDVQKHGFCDRHVNACPDVVRNHRVIALLRCIQDTLLLGLVLTRPHHTPTHVLGILAALNDRIILHTLLFNILHDTACIHRNVNHLGIDLTRGRRLKRTGNTIANLCKTCEIRRKLLRLLFTRHLLARIHEIRTGRARNLESTLPCLLTKDGVLCRTRFHTKQEVNGVLVGRLPLVDTRPRIASAFTAGSQRRVPGREDETIGRLLKLGLQDASNRSLHRSSVTCEKEFCFNLGRVAARGHELIAKVFNKELGVTQTRRIEGIRVATEKRQTASVLALVAVDIEDTELVEVGKILTIDGGSNMVIVKSHDAGPGDLKSVVDFEKTLVASHVEHRTLSIGLVRNRVVLEDVAGTLRTNMATLQGHDVDEVNAARIPLLPIAGHIAGRQNELGSLLG